MNIGHTSQCLGYTAMYHASRVIDMYSNGHPVNSSHLVLLHKLHHGVSHKQHLRLSILALLNKPHVLQMEQSMGTLNNSSPSWTMHYCTKSMQGECLSDK